MYECEGFLVTAKRNEMCCHFYFVIYLDLLVTVKLLMDYGQGQTKYKYISRNNNFLCRKITNERRQIACARFSLQQGDVRQNRTQPFT